MIYTEKNKYGKLSASQCSKGLYNFFEIRDELRGTFGEIAKFVVK